MNVLDDVSPLERVQISGALAGKVKALSGPATALERIRLASDIAALLKRLGVAGKAAQAVTSTDDLVFDLERREETVASLTAYLDGPMQQMPEALRVCEAATVAELAAQVGATSLIYRAKSMAADPLKTFAGAFGEVVKCGVSVDIDPIALNTGIEQALAIRKQVYGTDETWVATQAKMRSLNADIEQKTKSLDAQISITRTANRSALANGDRDAAAAAADLEYALHVQRREAVDAYTAAFAAARKEADAIAKSFKQDQQARANDAVRAQGEAILDAIRAASPVSAAEATAWALAQEVEDSAFKRLAKNGYPKAKVLQDLADFYRLSGGKASAISLVNTGSKRAYATNINTSTDKKIIAIDTNFTRTVLFHELAHHLENDAIAKAAANGFLVKRRESDKPYSLRSLTGNKGYGPREAAYKDSFLDAYIGKVYNDKTTEVFAMGVQYLASPLDTAILYAKDPELFALISGYLSSPLTPAMRARLNLHSGKIEEKADLAQQGVAAVKDLADIVALEPSTWFETFRASNDWEAMYSVNRAGGDYKKMKSVGISGVLVIIEGPVKVGSFGRGRASKGYIVMRDTGGYPDAVYAGKTLDDAKALIAAAQKNGNNIHDAKARYFGTNTTAEAIAELKRLASAGSEE